MNLDLKSKMKTSACGLPVPPLFFVSLLAWNLNVYIQVKDHGHWQMRGVLSRADPRQQRYAAKKASLPNGNP
jgi:hypothetical protein